MSITSFIHQEMEKNHGKSTQVRDFSVFDFNYVPQEPLVRDECKHLVQEMLRFQMTGIPTHQAMIGSKGSGKTLTVKYLQKEMHEQAGMNILYANCREHNTSFKIFAHLLGLQARGASLSELYRQFCQAHPDKTVVILDEIDLMSPKDKRRDILYFLSRSENPYMVVMLSNNHRVLQELDASTKSSLQPLLVYFKNYDAAQIQEILRDRARQGLHRWEEAQLAEIAALSTKKSNADARVAIKTLFYAVTEPDRGLEACFEKAREDIIMEMISNLADPLLMILKAIASSRSDFAKDVHQRYAGFSRQQQDKPFSYVHFYANLSYLQSMGLVALIATKVGITYANRVMLTFEESILDPIYRLRFGS